MNIILRNITDVIDVQCAWQAIEDYSAEIPKITDKARTITYEYEVEENKTIEVRVKCQVPLKAYLADVKQIITESTSE